MTVSQQSETPAAAPQAGGGDDISSNKSPTREDLESLIRSLVSTEVSERVALLESQRNDTNNDNPKGARRTNPSIDFAWQKKDTSATANDSPIKLVEGIPENNNDIEEALNERMLLIEQRLESYEDEKDILEDESEYLLSESTFSFLITHYPISIPFIFAMFSMALSISCLSLTLASSISKGTKGNILGIPAGVDKTVRAAQFLGALVGVLMEDEIPQGLQLIANAVGHTLMLNGQREVRKRVIISSIFRLVVGYLFLSSLFLNIIQNSDVIEIFYDVLALEFVENIDDTSFALAKRGFFGRRMLLATNQKYNLEMDERRSSVITGGRASLDTERRLSSSGLITSNNRVNIMAKLVYFLNVAIILAGLGYITQEQNNGNFRARRIQVLFDEVIWENANVKLNDEPEQRLLIYSYFNGLYKEDGSHHGHPRYVEQNKEDGKAFSTLASAPGAELVFCNEIVSWVFRHPNILSDHDCGWLWKAPETEDDYDILSTSGGVWQAWIGEAVLSQVIITSNECSDTADCNYFGSCEEGVCVCNSDRFGDSCEFELPCPSLATEKAQSLDLTGSDLTWNQENPIREVVGHSVYNRPLYIQTGLSGEPYDMRLYELLEKETSEEPSTQPSNEPSVSILPTPSPSRSPTHSPTTAEPSSSPTVSFPPTISNVPTTATNVPTSGSTPTVGTNQTTSPTEDITRPPFAAIQTDPPVRSQNEYDTAPDFATFDDFFERKSLHNLEDILEDYSVVLSYTGSRFYGTIIRADASLDELYSKDYHAFWDQSFKIDRTFIISDTTFSSTPVGVDWFEMRRRINSLLNPNVDFSYGPYGALIPVMNYPGTGFFHCIDEMPSTSPSWSVAPSSQPSTSPPCWVVNINIEHDNYPHEITWTMSKITDISKINNVTQADNMIVAEGCYSNTDDVTADGCPEEAVDKLCLQEGSYEFTIRDKYGDGISDPAGYYVIASNGDEIKRGGGDNGFKDVETTVFAMPLLEKPSTQPSISYSPTYQPSISAQPTTSSSPTEECWFVNINIEHDYPEDITWAMSKIIDISNEKNDTQADNMIVAEGCYPSLGTYNQDCLEEAVGKLCLQEGRYEFTIQNRDTGIYDPGYYVITSNGEEIKRGGGNNGFEYKETTVFNMPLLEKPSTQPTFSILPTNSLIPSSSPSVEFVCQVVSTKKECIKQLDSCMWDNEMDICIDAATSFPTFSPSTMPTSTSAYPRTSPPSIITPFPTESGGFNCPAASFVGCTAPDPSDFEDECSTVGQPCINGSPGEFCCRDACPRNYCTARQAS